MSAFFDLQESHYPCLMSCYNSHELIGQSVWDAQYVALLTGNTTTTDRKNKRKFCFVFFADFPQIFRGKFAVDVERKRCQGCQTFSISVMILEQIAK